MENEEKGTNPPPEIVELAAGEPPKDDDDGLLQQEDEDPYAHLSTEERVTSANAEKDKGNQRYAESDYAAAVEHYTQALRLAPPGHSCRAVFYSNRAACYLAQNSGRYEEVIKDTTEALAIDDKYVKALARRAQAYEALGKLSEALKDFEAVLALDPSQKQAQEASKRLPGLIHQKQEEEKEKMIQQLKDMGNSLLGRFGISLDNFKMEKDPATGNYSIKMG